MSLHSVRAFLAEHAPDIEILEATTSTATVALAAAAHGVQPSEIAKTLSLRVGDEPILMIGPLGVPLSKATLLSETQ